MERGDASWGRTELLRGRLQQHGLLERREGEDFYAGRHIIHRGSKIDGGVYLGANAREAIVVDSEKYPEIPRLYGRAKKRARRFSRFEEGRVLRSVFETVKKAIPHQSEAAVDTVLQEMKVGPDKKVALDAFLRTGAGVCRHDALACGVLLELFKEDGFIKGTPSVDRNSTVFGGHAWCRYTDSTGEVHILDVAQDYFGPLKSAPGERRWAYERPEDF